jgi:hypothetical protein
VVHFLFAVNPILCITGKPIKLFTEAELAFNFPFQHIGLSLQGNLSKKHFTLETALRYLYITSFRLWNVRKYMQAAIGHKSTQALAHIIILILNTYVCIHSTQRYTSSRLSVPLALMQDTAVEASYACRCQLYRIMLIPSLSFVHSCQYIDSYRFDYPSEHLREWKVNLSTLSRFSLAWSSTMGLHNTLQYKLWSMCHIWIWLLIDRDFL